MAAVPKKEPINQKSEVRKVERALLAAIKHDIDTLAKKFLESEDLSLQRFGRLFNEMEFPTIFIGHLSFADLVEFSENLFHYAAHYMFGPLTNRAVPNYVQLPELQTEATKNKLAQMFPGPEQRTNEQRIFGIFVTYCLYFVQPNQYVVPVFTTKLQLDDLYEFMATVLLPDDYSEPLYCLFRLVQANAFAIYPFDGKFNPLLHRYFTLFDGDGVGGGDEIDSHELENLEDLGRLRELARDYNIQQLENLHQLYMEEKRQNNSIGLPQSALAPREGPHEMLNRLIQETEAKMRNNSSAGANSSSILEQIKMENVTGEHPKTLLSRRNKIRQMAFTQNTSFRRDRRHRNMAADESMDNYDEHQPSSSSTIQQKQKSPRKAIKRETNEGGEEEEGKARKRRRSTRSRTHEFEGSDDPVEAAILREIEMLANSSNENENRLLQITNEPSEMDQIMASMLVHTADNDNEMEIDGGSSQPQPTADASNQPGPSTSSTSREELERKIEAIKGNEAETDKLWAQILAEKTLEQQQEKQQKKKTSNRGRPRKKQ